MRAEMQYNRDTVRNFIPYRFCISFCPVRFLSPGIGRCADTFLRKETVVLCDPSHLTATGAFISKARRNRRFSPSPAKIRRRRGTRAVPSTTPGGSPSRCRTIGGCPFPTMSPPAAATGTIRPRPPRWTGRSRARRLSARPDPGLVPQDLYRPRRLGGQAGLCGI